jgi:hypothetical protein
VLVEDVLNNIFHDLQVEAAQAFHIPSQVGIGKLNFQMTIQGTTLPESLEHITLS